MFTRKPTLIVLTAQDVPEKKEKLDSPTVVEKSTKERILGSTAMAKKK
jgi:hypothetical protein